MTIQHTLRSSTYYSEHDPSIEVLPQPTPDQHYVLCQRKPTLLLNLVRQGSLIVVNAKQSQLQYEHICQQKWFSCVCLKYTLKDTVQSCDYQRMFVHQVAPW